MEKELTPLHDLRKPQLILSESSSESVAPVVSTPVHNTPEPEEQAPISPQPVPPSIVDTESRKTGVVAYNFGTADYKLATQQMVRLVAWLTLLAVLGGLLAVMVAGVTAFITYRRHIFGFVARNQYKTLVMAVIIANAIGLILYSGFFVAFWVFRESFSGYYILSFILTIAAQGLLGYAKIAQYNQQTDARR